VDKFTNYFRRKATIIRNKKILNTPKTPCNISMDADIMFNGNKLEMFLLTSEIEVKEIIIGFQTSHVTWIHSPLDIPETLDEGSMTALIMLDLSAAFNVINHQSIFRILL